MNYPLLISSLCLCLLEFFTEKSRFWFIIKTKKIIISIMIVVLVALDSRDSSKVQAALAQQVLESKSFPVIHFHQSQWNPNELEFVITAHDGPLENLFVEIEDTRKFVELRHMVWYDKKSPRILSDAKIRKEISLVPANEGVNIGTLPLTLYPRQIGLTFTFKIRTRKGTYWGRLGAVHNGERWANATEIYLRSNRIYYQAWRYFGKLWTGDSQNIAA